MKYYLYRHIRLDKNIPFYIGIGTNHNNNYERAYIKRKRTAHWNNIINKTDYKVDILYESDFKEEINNKEVEFILMYGRKCDGGVLVNHTLGGDGISGYNHTDFSKKKMSDSKKGKTTWNKGIKNSKEKRLKISNALTGRKWSKEHKENFSKIRKGKTTKKAKPFNFKGTSYRTLRECEIKIKRSTYFIYKRLISKSHKDCYYE